MNVFPFSLNTTALVKTLIPLLCSKDLANWHAFQLWTMEFDLNNSNFLYGKITIVYISENCFKLSFEDQIECI